MSTFIDRCCENGNWETETPNEGVNLGVLRLMLELYEAGDANVTASFMKTQLSCTEGQGGQLDNILATLPATVEILGVGLSPAARSRWVAKVMGILDAGLRNWTGFTTSEAVEAKLGI